MSEFRGENQRQQRRPGGSSQSRGQGGKRGQRDRSRVGDSHNTRRSSSDFSRNDRSSRDGSKPRRSYSGEAQGSRGFGRSRFNNEKRNGEYRKKASGEGFESRRYEDDRRDGHRGNYRGDRHSDNRGDNRSSRSNNSRNSWDSRKRQDGGFKRNDRFRKREDQNNWREDRRDNVRSQEGQSSRDFNRKFDRNYRSDRNNYSDRSVDKNRDDSRRKSSSRNFQSSRSYGDRQSSQRFPSSNPRENRQDFRRSNDSRLNKDRPPREALPYKSTSDRAVSKTRFNSDGTISFPSQNPYTHRRPDEPVMPAGMQWSMLSLDERERLRGLSKEHAENTALHILASYALIDDDPQAALEHARWVARQASRVEFARETLGFIAYRCGDFSLAARELRTAFRMNGFVDYLPFIADCERGLGHLSKALELATNDQARMLVGESKMEMFLVYAGILADMGQLDKAITVADNLGRAQGVPGEYRMRALQAEQNFLEKAGRTDEALALDDLLERLELQYAENDDEDEEEELVDFDMHHLDEMMMMELGITAEDAQYAPRYSDYRTSQTTESEEEVEGNIEDVVEEAFEDEVTALTNEATEGIAEESTEETIDESTDHLTESSTEDSGEESLE